MSSSATGSALRSRSVQAGGVRLHVWEWGEARAPPLLFWHGLGDHNGLQIGEAAPLLVDEFELRVLGLDAPGFGRSPALPLDAYDLDALAGLVPLLLEGLDVPEVVFVGASWGAWVAIRTASIAPVRVSALVLLDGGYLQPRLRGGETLEELIGYWRAQPGFRFGSWDDVATEAKTYFRRWSAQLELGMREVFREEDGAVVSIMGPERYASAAHALRRWPEERLLPALAASGKPVLLLAASEATDYEEKRQAALRRFAQAVRQAEVQTVPDARHSLLEDQPERVARAVGEWLRRNGPFGPAKEGRSAH